MSPICLPYLFLRRPWTLIIEREDDVENNIIDYYAKPLIPYLSTWIDRIERVLRWIKPDGTEVYGDERAYHGWKFETAESFKQGYHLHHPEYGWIWTHPQTYPKVWVMNQNRWMDAKGLSKKQDYANLELSTWQGYVGDTVVLAWDTDKQNNLVEIDGVQSQAKIGAWSVPLEEAGEMVATMQAGDTRLEKKVVVFPKPSNPTVWIDAHPKVVAPNEKFLVSWNVNGGVPILSGESQGIFSNEGTGSVAFSKAIAGDYTYKVRLGDAVQTVTICVEGELVR